jgi:glutamyl-tRNA reductase
MVSQTKRGSILIMTFDEMQKTIEGMLAVQMKQQETLTRLETLAEKTLMSFEQLIEDLETQEDIRDIKTFHEEMARGEVEFVTWEVAKKELELN